VTISAGETTLAVEHTDRFFIGGQWVTARGWHGGFKQSGIGREGGVDGLLPFLESKAMLLDGPTSRYSDVQL
jgi:acyl-CoA reductase-like NAD-dependent aldehyde dehydrogenase